MWCCMRSRQSSQKSGQSIRRCSRKRQAADDLFDLDRPKRRGVRRRRPELAGCSAFGETEEEALSEVKVAIDGSALRNN